MEKIKENQPIQKGFWSLQISTRKLGKKRIAHLGGILLSNKECLLEFDKVEEFFCCKRENWYFLDLVSPDGRLVNSKSIQEDKAKELIGELNIAEAVKRAYTEQKYAPGTFAERATKYFNLQAD